VAVEAHAGVVMHGHWRIITVNSNSFTPLVLQTLW